MATIIKTDGTLVTLKPEGPKGTLTLEQMQKAVGGYIETVTLRNGNIMVIDEEGKCKGKPLNPVATDRAALRGDFIVGDAIICKSKEVR